MKQIFTPLIIAGPTASGKSAYALDLAQKMGGAIINGDSMQIYADMPVLTAQPSESEKSLVPHRLYGVLKGFEVCSAARWRDLALQEIKWCHEHSLKPIIVGGTGLYFMALMKGLSEVPDVNPEVRNAARDLCAELGAQAFYGRLVQVDPLIEGRLNPNDSQRLIRAYEVFMATGKSLIEWQSSPPMEPGIACEMMVIERPREILHQRAEARFDLMLEAGAIEEVEILLEQNYDCELPVMRALGVKELSAYIKGELNLPQARELAIIATRQYIKRQSAFFRNQFPEAERAGILIR